MITKIISGGQTGADQGGWNAADRLGIEKGGYMPAGYRTHTGDRPDFASWVKCTTSRNYPPRTKLNVLESDATFIFGRLSSRGSMLTMEYCSMERKKHLYIPWVNYMTQYTIDIWIDKMKDFFVNNPEVRVLNVAGNRESTNPGIFNAVSDMLVIALQQK